MTDSDRLRAAADLLVMASDLADDIVGPTTSSEQGRLTAALLRCIADAARQQGTDAVWWPLIESGIWADARALATSILGGEQ